MATKKTVTPTPTPTPTLAVAPAPEDVIDVTAEIEEAELAPEIADDVEPGIDDGVSTVKKKRGKGALKKGKVKKEPVIVVKPIDDSCPDVELRREALRLKDALDDDHYAMGDILTKLYRESTFTKWGYATWPQYVESELDFARRKADYCIAISEFIGRLRPEFAAEFRKMPWTAVRELCTVVTNENASEWLARVKGQTVAGIAAMRRSVKSTGEITDGENKKLKSVAFKCSEEQVENITRALARAEAIAGNDAKGLLLDLICTDFLAHNTDGLGIHAILDGIERASGLKLVAFTAEGAVPYGEETLDAMLEVLGGDAAGTDDEPEFD